MSRIAAHYPRKKDDDALTERLPRPGDGGRSSSRNRAFLRKQRPAMPGSLLRAARREPIENGYPRRGIRLP